MNSVEYRVCSRCIMDTTDPDIIFDAYGVCNHCLDFDQKAPKFWKPGIEGRKEIDSIFEAIKSEQRDKEYDAVIGLSGGVDSSYLAYIAVEVFKLRLLAVHVDGGWNSELAVKNIENIVNTLGIDLYTEVIDWEEMRDLQVSFLKAAVANQDVPQDHAFFAALYRTAIKHKIRHVLSGGNYATESIMPFEWAYNAMDLTHLKGIHKRFGKQKLKSYPTVNFFDYYFRFPYINRMTVVRPLNYWPYNKEEAIRTLEKEVGFRYYGGKHFESRFTKWQQLQYRPMKFGYDERRAYLSSLILSGQLRRDEALSELAGYCYSDFQQKEDAGYVRKKLNLTENEFEQILALPTKTFRDYPSEYWLLKLKDKFKDFMGRFGINFKGK
jgi:N-acetyl sugar amidotransferase